MKELKAVSVRVDAIVSVLNGLDYTAFVRFERKLEQRSTKKKGRK